MRSVAIVTMMVAVALAGCAGESEPEAVPDVVVSPENVVLKAGKGAISGLLVDDRFRPIQLTNEPETEFQTTGFVLLQETGQQLQTTENGEFAFIDLDPGTYTIRVTAGGHEATPQRVSVTEGVFNEISVVARRISSAGSAIVSQEYSVFVPCGVRVIANGYTVGCVYDRSGDTFRSSFESNYTAFGDQATHLVTEMVPNQRGGYRVQVRAEDYPEYSGYYRYGTENNYDTDYIRIDNPYGVAMEDVDNFYQDNKPWENDAEFNTILFPLGQFEKEVIENWPNNPVINPCCGLGFRLGVRGQFVQSVFIGEPEVDVYQYCVLC